MISEKQKSLIHALSGYAHPQKDSVKSVWWSPQEKKSGADERGTDWNMVDLTVQEHGLFVKSDFF